MPTIKSWLLNATSQLEKVKISSAKLDAEIILAHTLNVGRTYLYAHPEDDIQQNKLNLANKNLNDRLLRRPIAYITGVKEFYGREFQVSPDTLIPRPESEDMITILKKLVQSNTSNNDQPISLLDIGTGSGALGITAQLELPILNTTLADISPEALKIAKLNTQKHHLKLQVLNSDLLSAIDFSPDIILANLPYVDTSWDRSPETNFEPSIALFADDGGLQLIHRLINQSAKKLASSGLLILEADPEQHDKIIIYADKHSLTHIETLNYCLAFIKPQA